jgi:hypothetical protein
MAKRLVKMEDLAGEAKGFSEDADVRIANRAELERIRAMPAAERKAYIAKKLEAAAPKAMGKGKAEPKKINTNTAAGRAKAEKARAKASLRITVADGKPVPEAAQAKGMKKATAAANKPTKASAAKPKAESKPATTKAPDAKPASSKPAKAAKPKPAVSAPKTGTGMATVAKGKGMVPVPKGTAMVPAPKPKPGTGMVPVGKPTVTSGKAAASGKPAAAASAPKGGVGGKVLGNIISPKALVSELGGGYVAGKIRGDGKSAGRNILATVVDDATTGYAVGRQYGAVAGAAVGLVRGAQAEGKRSGKAPLALPTTPKQGGTFGGVKPATGGSKGPTSRGGARGKFSTPVASASKPAAPKAAAPAKKAVNPASAASAKPSTSTKGVDSVGSASYDMHTAFRKELETGGGRPAWSMDKKVASGGATVEISKPASSGTTLQAELDKFQSSGGKAPKKDMQIGGLMGRSDGKWHLRRKPGKG